MRIDSARQTIRFLQDKSIQPDSKKVCSLNKPENINFKVTISDEGKQLSRKLNTDVVSASGEELNAIKEEKEYRKECKERIKGIDDILSKDDITDKERNKLLDEKKLLEKSSWDSEDALYDAYKKKRDFNKRHNIDECNSGDRLIIDKVNTFFDRIIQEKKDVISRENEHEQSLRRNQIQETADIELEKQKANKNEMNMDSVDKNVEQLEETTDLLNLVEKSAAENNDSKSNRIM
ncbi:hypothetical protein SELR_03880 [Selenomonas ruminantium subsp. lactilytica TAM6421]|uniref:Uncharacterized protein n=1 Tax=Selenomonas ruminantium subsp. lactilytica (strain NBRC 103574 / TAM6421) TaxID=927704 RepID=I0GMV9_SELRL|nr:hypothetical protein [Selenomonas ruminantium]BAL82096.1 hypothetical protein SELR_03880 [Selenomonas ruminantium subsp. lactilytica TAM6421]